MAAAQRRRWVEQASVEMVKLVLAERCWVGKKRFFFLRGLMFSHWERDHFLNDVPTLRDSFAAFNKPILDFWIHFLTPPTY